jgi:hypothetical protein
MSRGDSISRGIPAGFSHNIKPVPDNPSTLYFPRFLVFLLYFTGIYLSLMSKKMNKYKKKRIYDIAANHRY